MSHRNLFPLPSDYFNGGARLTADGGHGDDLAELLNSLHSGRAVVRVPARAFAFSTGANRPTPAAIGAVIYAGFSVNDILYVIFTLPKDADATKDVTIHVDWAPVLGEVGRTVSWEGAYLVTGAAAETIDTVDGTPTVVDDLVPVVQWEGDTSLFTVLAADLNAEDIAIHFRLTRIASSNDPASIAATQIWAEVQTAPLL